ncbi:unnamed protein product, partial [Brassica napus]
ATYAHERQLVLCIVSSLLVQSGGHHHTKEDYAVRGKEPKDEVQIYTWKDANLRELTDLVKEVSVAARRKTQYYLLRLFIQTRMDALLSDRLVRRCLILTENNQTTVKHSLTFILRLEIIWM